MDIKEARKICEEIVNKNKEIALENKAIIMLGDVLDTAEKALVDVNIARPTLASLQEQIVPLEEKYSKITQETVDLEIHYDNLKVDLDTKYEERESEYTTKIASLEIAQEEEERIIKGKNNELQITLTTLENDIIEKQEQLDSINTILNSKRD